MNHHSRNKRPAGSQAQRRPRKAARGVAVLIVLLLLSITLALSYSMMRVQSTTSQLQRNQNRRTGARQAALAGLAAGLRKMHQRNWAGVGVDLAGDLGDGMSYVVSFDTGDPSLNTADPAYSEYPYRVTVTSRGTAVDPVDPRIQSTHAVAAVVRLVRRTLSNPPSNWVSVQQHTLYQWANLPVHVHVPVRIEGPVHTQGELRLCTDIPDSTAGAPAGETGEATDFNETLQDNDVPRNPRSRYLRDLEAMRVAGLGDLRPFDGPLSFPFGLSSPATLVLVQDDLKVTTKNVVAVGSPPLSHPGRILTYQLYPGGKAYGVETIPSSLYKTALEPNPIHNPLGVFYHDGRVDIYDDVTIRGTLINRGSTDGDIHVWGKNVRFQPVDLPPLAGTSGRVQLPVAILQGGFRLRGGAKSEIGGLACFGDELEVEQAARDQIALAVRGRVICKELLIRRRNEWNRGSQWWAERFREFLDQLARPGPIPFFPQWLNDYYGLNPKPLLTLGPDSAGVSYHWHDWSKAVFVPHPNDQGLCWDLISWKDNP